MDRDAKRKASVAALGDFDGRAAKRQRMPASNNPNESLLEAGLRFITTLKNAKDKTGRPIATDFLDLPARNLYPDYYDQIALPISIHTIETKLRADEYIDLAGVESDLKRMVNNAKTYNEKGSDIYDDAERVRKTASNWMVRFNPSYKDLKYVAQPTPLPEGAQNGVRGVGKPAIVSTQQQVRSKAPEVQPPPASAPVEDDSEFAGKTFQQAQDMIVVDLMDFRDEDGVKIFQPFHFLPPRALKDYYELIRHPVSLMAVQKKVRGIHGKATSAQATNITDFATWKAFEDEVSFIWKNCREYNEDGSEMYLLADDFEEAFKSLVEEAKARVEGPAGNGTTLKIKVPPKPPAIKLRLGGASRDSPGTSSHRGTPDQRNSSTPGAVDQTSLHQSHRPSINGNHVSNMSTPHSNNPFGGARPDSIPPLGLSIRRSGSAQSPPLTTNGVKPEGHPGYSPAPGAVRPTSGVAGYPNQYNSATMLPPTTAARMTSGSPHPYAQPVVPQYHIPPPANSFEKKYRAPGKTIKDSLLPTVTLKSHPSLSLPKPYTFAIPAHPDRASQSLTITLPSLYHTLLVIPTLPAFVTAKPYRLIVVVNGQKLSPMAATPSLAGAEGEEKGKKAVFEARLKAGEVNSVDVEVLVVGREEEGGKEVVQWEKTSVFVYLR